LEESLAGSLGGMGRSFLCVLAGTLLPYDHKETPLWHLRIPSRACQRHIELAPDYSILLRTVTNLSLTLRTHYSLYEPLQKDPPPWHLRIPLRTRQGNTELAPHCYTEPAPHCRTLTSTEPPYPSYTLYEPTVTHPSTHCKLLSTFYTPLQTS
jgi:hypothetical protein